MTSDSRFLVSFARRCRDVTVTLIAGLWPGRDAEDIEQVVNNLPLRTQGLVVAGVLGLLFALSLFAAQFGLLGMAVFFLAVVVLIT